MTRSNGADAYYHRQDRKNAATQKVAAVTAELEAQQATEREALTAAAAEANAHDPVFLKLFEQSLTASGVCLTSMVPFEEQRRQAVRQSLAAKVNGELASTIVASAFQDACSVEKDCDCELVSGWKEAG